MITPGMESTVKKLVEGIPVKALQNGKLNEKFVEIVVRQTDGTISGIVKCALGGENRTKTMLNVFSKVATMGNIGTVSSLANNVQTEMVRQEVKKVGKDVKKLLEMTKDMSINIDKIAQGMSVVQTLSILNTAVSAINCGISIAGFINVNKKLDALQKEMQKMYCTVEDLKNIQVSTIFNTGTELISKTKILFQHIQDGDCTQNNYEQLLGQYREYLRNMKTFMEQGSIDYEKAYQIVMNLLPRYVDILKKYVLEYYYGKNKFPESEYAEDLGVIMSFAESQFMEHFFDYAYLERNCTKLVSEEALQVHLLLVGNAYTQIEDAKGLILALPDKGSYITLQEVLTKEAHRRVDSLLSTISEPMKLENMRKGFC